MKKTKIIVVYIVLLLIILSNFTFISTAEDADSIAPLTVPTLETNINAHIDVFERLELEKQNGYLSSNDEIIEDSYYFTTKQGFDYVHLEGSYDEIGYNHAKLLWPKIERGMAAYAFLTEMRYNMNWDVCRTQGASYWPHMSNDKYQIYQEEIDGIVRGCQEMNARNPDGNVIDRWDIMAYNAIWDIWWRSSPPPIFEKWWPFSVPEQKEMIHHCSGFVANGDYTINGEAVIAQNLWMPYYLPPSHGVFADIIPPDGNRMLMELQAGMIWSGTEWYLNEEGLVVGETTLGNAPYQWGNTPAFVRIRYAVQYSNSIDEFRDNMLTDTNGAYCGDYLIIDAETNEVGILELGSHEYELWRSDNGFHGSCNYPWDPEVRDEMMEPEGWDHSCYPRYMRLEQISNKYKGQIDTSIGRRALGDHWDTVEERENKCSWTLEGRVENASGYPHGALDGKTTNRSMVQNHEVWAKYGFPSFENFIASEHAKEHPDYAFPNLEDMISQPWTTFGFLEPITVSVLDTDGNPVEGAQIAFENCADGYLHEGKTGTDGTYTHPYFSTGTYNISAKDGNYRGLIHVEFNQMNSFEVVLTEVKSDEGMKLGTKLSIAVLGLIIFIVAVTVIAKKFKKSQEQDSV
ncbi:MAG: carboxypeptidase regulatory-like domain-containing protein [Thermoplasmata archaeon]|nr:MAG: carboxypeptidase regulatory-like domain-containing protein [Thermoplasmata archaeon]